MRLHDRYLFRELITPLAFCLGAFLVVGVSLFFKEELNTIQERKLDLMETVLYCLTSLPDFFVVVLPILLLLSMLYALTNHARHHELTALRAAGVSLWRLCAPYFAVGLAATLLAYATNEFAVPACHRWAQDLLSRHAAPEAHHKPAAHGVKTIFNAPAQRQWQFTEFDPRAARMLNATVTWTLADHAWHVLHADHAVRTNGVWVFYDVRMYQDSGPKSELVPTGANAVLPLPEFDETPEKIELLLNLADTQSLRGASYADIPLTELWAFTRHRSELTREVANAMATKFYDRLAAPWTCLVVVLVAIPFGAPSGRRNLFFGVAGSIFIGFTYFILQKVSLAFGLSGQLPGWLAAWLPNWVFAATGLILTARVR